MTREEAIKILNRRINEVEETRLDSDPAALQALAIAIEILNNLHGIKE